MAKLEVIMRNVDGSMLDFSLPPHELTALYRLQRQGLTGKALIHEWLTDDLKPPPIYIEVSGKDPDGNPVNLKLLYD